MAEPYIGQIMMFGGNFAPQGWALCNGQLLQISQNSALFSLLGTIYGGDGQSTFALPDLRGRVPMHFGQGSGLSNRVIGQKSGQEDVVLTETQMPPHNHTLKARPLEGDSANPQGNVMAKSGQGDPDYYTGTDGLVAMDGSAVDSVGGGQQHTNMPPFQVVTYIIALVGTFPTQG